MIDKVQEIRKGIEILKSQLIKGACASQVAMETRCKEEAYNEVLAILDSLQEEPVSKDLEQAAKDYSNNLDNIYGSMGEQTRNAFKNGAKWKKEQMMKKAIDAQCFGFQGAALFSFRLPADNYLVGSKIKVIIIKEE